MKAFEYATAQSTDSARQLVADHGAYLAGGNDLLGLLKEYLIERGHSRQHQVAARSRTKSNAAKNSGPSARSSPSRKSRTARKSKRFFPACTSRVGNRLAANPQRRHRRRQSLAAFALLVFPPSRHALPQERRRPVLRARRREPLPQPLHRQRLHQPGRVEPRHGVRRARRHRHRAAATARRRA